MTNHADNKSKRDAIIRKVKALLAKTTENGCSEQEAMSASSLAADLMKEHDLAYTDMQTEVEQQRFGARRRKYAEKKQPHPVVKYCSIDIGTYWDCKVTRDRQDNIVFFGDENDTENALLMLTMFQMAADTEFARYWKTEAKPNGIAYSTARTSFMHGMVDRLVTRLREAKAARTAVQTRTGGTSLVVVKGQIVNDRFAAFAKSEGLRCRSIQSRIRPRSRDAYHAGQRSGDRVDLGGSKLGGSHKMISG